MDNANMTPDLNEQPEAKKSNTGMIIGIVVVVLLCCCCIFALSGWYLWQNGDQLLRGATGLLSSLV